MEAIAVILFLDAIALVGLICFLILNRKDAKKTRQLKAE
jgi:hypothetical protein